jgi:O-antigen/teichoic acid export membrane protein
MRKQLFIGSMTGVLQIILNSILIFITIPFFINKLGLELYGVFALLLLIGNINVFLNLGLNSSLIKYLAEQGKTLQSNYDIVSALMFLLALLFPVTVLGIVFNKFILINVFNINQILLKNGIYFLFDILLISNSLIILGQIFSAILDSQQKVYLNNFFQMIYNFLYWGSILLCLVLSPDLKMIGIGIFVAALVWFLLVVIFSMKSWGYFELNGLTKNFIHTLKKQLSYSSKLYTSGTISFFYEPLTKLLISHFIGINEVGYFDIAIRIRNQIWNLIGKIFYPIFPLIAKLNDKNQIRNLIHEIEQKAVYLIIPAVVATLIISRPVITLWIGSNINLISLTLIFIMEGYLLASLVIPTYQFLMVKGYPGKTIIIQTTNVIVNGVLFFVTLPYIGYYSVIVCNFGAILSSFIVTLFYQKKILNVFIVDSKNQLMRILIILGFNLMIGYGTSYLISSNLIIIILVPAMLLSVSLILYRELRVFSLIDIRKYFGSGNWVESMLSAVLIKRI